MLRIGPGLSGVDLTAQLNIQRNFEQLSASSLKLATLKRINRGSDDPAGLIAAETLRRELTSINEAAEALERTRAFVHVADSGLSEASTLLNEIQANVLAASGDTASPAEKKALQLEIDAALDALDRIGNTASFAGKKVFDGTPLQVLTGPDPNDLETLSLLELNSGVLGSDQGTLHDLRSGGIASVDQGDPSLAAEILNAARSEILTTRAETGAFERYTIDATQRVLEDSVVNLSSAYSQIQDTDVAAESANLARSLVLTDAAIESARLTRGARMMIEGLFADLWSSTR